MEADLLFHRQHRNLPSVKTGIPHTCDWPWHQLNIDSQGRLFVCGCDAWVPFSVGNVNDFKSFAEIFSSPMAQKIQTSITDKKFEYCDTRHCGVMQQNQTTLYDYYLHIGIDDSCNLHCPSCRKEKIFRSDADWIDPRIDWIERINEWIEQVPDKTVHIMIGANGDPFASLIYRHLIKRVDFAQNVTFSFRTNGLLMRKHLEEFTILPRIRNLDISIDAATETTYAVTRRGGSWPILIENLKFAKQLKQRYDLQLVGNFVVQKANFREIPAFAKLCSLYGLLPSYQILQDWGTYDNFNEQCVHNPTNTDYKEFCNIVNDKSWQTPYMHVGALYDHVERIYE
jgi:MoaA/NifB/PqqE/SkfB family radical SAM enzyme